MQTPSLNIITAAQGLFLKLESNVELEWGLEKEIDMIVEECKEEEKNLIEILCHHVKVDSEFSKKLMNNKVYVAHWKSGIADMLISLKRNFDHPFYTDELTKLFQKPCQTEFPVSQGVCFEDLYLDDEWNVRPNSPLNNCCLQTPYVVNVTEEDVTIKSLTLHDHCKRLHRFIEPFYYDNEALLTLKLAMMHMAIRRLSTGMS